MSHGCGTPPRGGGVLMRDPGVNKVQENCPRKPTSCSGMTVLVCFAEVAQQVVCLTRKTSSRRAQCFGRIIRGCTGWSVKSSRPPSSDLSTASCQRRMKGGRGGQGAMTSSLGPALCVCWAPNKVVSHRREREAHLASIKVQQFAHNLFPRARGKRDSGCTI